MLSSLSSLIVTALAVTAGAIPTLKQPMCKGVKQNANFDDLTGLPGNAVNPLPRPYKGLYYQAFDYATVIDLGLLPGVVPHSGPNYATAGVLSELRGTPMLTTYYPNSKVQRFDLESFYFGCAVQLANGATAVPNACNIQVTGYQGSDNSVANAKQVCAQQFSYNPSTALGPQQQDFSGKVKKCFKDLQFATVTFELPGGQAALQTLAGLTLDDVKYTTYTCKK